MENNTYIGMKNNTCTEIQNSTYCTLESVPARFVKYALPPIVLFGLTGNILSLITVMKGHKDKHSSFTMCIAALSICDNVSLIVNAVYFWARFALGVSVNSTGVISCKLMQFFGYAFPCMSQLLITSMTIERLLVTYFPYKIRKWLVPKTGLIIIGTIVAVALILFGHLLHGADLRATNNATLCVYADNSLMTFFLATKMIYPSTFLVIVICNIAIIIKVIKANTRIHPGTVPTVTILRKKQNRQMLTMVLLINMFCLLFNTPYIAYYTTQSYKLETNFDMSIPTTDNYELLLCIAGILLVLNYSVNFYLYVLSGSQFRKDLKTALCG